MNSEDFQTPPDVCDYMVSLLSKESYDVILEPTPGNGNLARAAKEKGNVISPTGDFFAMDGVHKVDAVVMNPPFTPMKLGYEILGLCMEMTDEVVALMPWLTIINSGKRVTKYLDYGLKSVTHLPRSVFPGTRVQCCILHLKKGHHGETKIHFYNL